MAIKKYLDYKNNVFNSAVLPVEHLENHDSLLLQIMQDLYDTHFQNLEQIGVGLAANQIGYRYSVFLCYISEKAAKKNGCAPLPLSFWVNATYSPTSEETNLASEGCYSVPGMIGHYIKRFTNIIVNGEAVNFSVDANNTISLVGRKQASIALSDFHARLFQHEIDHLDPVRPKFYFEYLDGGIDALEVIEKQ